MLQILTAVLFLSSFPTGAAVSKTEMKPFVDHLMSRMTVEEKFGQMQQYAAEMAITGANTNSHYRSEISKGRVGSILNAYGAKFTYELQKVAVEKSRLKIPLIFGYDVIHGFKTIFPIPLAESASWDLALIEKSARLAANEAAAEGIHWTFAPMVDIARDPRWGRIAEGAGEDPWLGSQIAAARVQGFQGTEPGAVDRVLACVKHFAAYGAPIAGRDYNSVDMSQRELFETYLPPYEAAVKAGAATVMTAFNDIAGVPSTANKWLLTDLLRQRWQFKGFVVSDYTAVDELIPHGVAADKKQAAKLALNAGVDMEMQGGLFTKHGPTLAKRHMVDRASLDRSVRRILEAKYKLGLFSDPYRFINEERQRSVVMAPDKLAHAREIARHSIVLLKNNNSILPLKKSDTLAFIGPFATNQRDLIGNWAAAGEWKDAVSLVDGVRSVAGDPSKILTTDGADLKAAVRMAEKADVVVLALGETQDMSGEAASRTQIRIPAAQQDLLRAVHQTGKPIVLVLFNGRPLALELENQMSDAIVESWFLGTQSGLAIADVLFGDYNPSGKLTVSFPVNEGQIPIYYARKATGRPFDAKVKYTSKYLDAPNEPLFPFGWGLSYTQFKYSPIRFSSKTLNPKQKLKVSVTVTNSGNRDGEETVQLYIHDPVASVSRPLQQLRGFAKVFLKKGESRDVTLELGIEDLKFYNQAMKWVAEPGVFTVMIGGNSRDVTKADFTLINNNNL